MCDYCSVTSATYVCSTFTAGSVLGVVFFFFKQKTAYEVRISDWSSDVCSSDLPADLARVMDWLRRHTETGPAAEARRILGLNPGIPADAASHWAYVGYKGGSEPGVLDMTLLLHHKSGGWYSLRGTWTHPDAPHPEGRLTGLLSQNATPAAQ